MNGTWPFRRSAKLILARHGEALKNVRDEHGGSGTALTDRGKRQARVLAEQIALACDGNTESVCLLAHNVPQVAETAKIVSSEIGLGEVTMDERLRGLDLGVIAGMSRADAATEYPEAAQRLEDWRHGRLLLNELRLPGSESVDQFRRRVVTGLGEAVNNAQGTVAMVLTRSVLIMVTNLLSLGEQFSYEMYRSYEFPPAALCAWHVTSDQARLLGD